VEAEAQQRGEPLMATTGTNTTSPNSPALPPIQTSSTAAAAAASSTILETAPPPPPPSPSASVASTGGGRQQPPPRRPPVDEESGEEEGEEDESGPGHGAACLPQQWSGALDVVASMGAGVEEAEEDLASTCSLASSVLSSATHFHPHATTTTTHTTNLTTPSPSPPGGGHKPLGPAVAVAAVEPARLRRWRRREEAAAVTMWELLARAFRDAHQRGKTERGRVVQTL
jgi:hypothetical protein